MVTDNLVTHRLRYFLITLTIYIVGVGSCFLPFPIKLLSIPFCIPFLFYIFFILLYDDSTSTTTWYIGGGLGATQFELQIRRFYLTITRPKYMNHRSWPWIKITWLTKEGNIPVKGSNK
jgi:hypothetical protein